MSIYNLEHFGRKMKEIRKNLNLNQNKIAEETGITDKTIRRIENGKVLPALDTLEILSAYYNTDLISLLLQYRLDDYSVFCEIKKSIETKLYDKEENKLNNELESLKILLSSTKNSYYKNIIRQLILFTEAVILCEDRANEAALKKFTEAIKTTIPAMNMENYRLYTYSLMEIRILMNIGFAQERLKNKNKCLEIMKFCLDSVESKDEIYSKICHNLATFHIRDNDFKKTLEYSDLGIKSCQESNNYFILPILFYQKGFAQCKLNDDNYVQSFATAMCLCDAFNKKTLKESMIHDCKNLLNINI